MNHRVGRAVFALVVGLLVATYSYRWITDPEGRAERARQEVIVNVSRAHLESTLGISSLEIVDPLAPNRKAGKVYIYAEDGGWAVSGFYRRDENDQWHPYLMTLNNDQSLSVLRIQDGDQQLIERAASDPLLEISP